jgi:uncharacterized protein YacL
MSLDFFIRIIGMIVFAIFGGVWGQSLGASANINPGPNTLNETQYTFSLALVGALFGLVMTPFFTTYPTTRLRRLFGQLSGPTLLSSMLGLLVGLLVAALLSFPLSLLPSPLGDTFPFVAVLVMCYFGIAIFVMRQNDLLSTFNNLLNRSSSTLGQPAGQSSTSSWNEGRTILLDTSVIIDGRIADIARTGFLPGTMLIPRFVLTELQYIADSPDSLRRQRGRRGMEVLTQLQREPSVPVRMSDIDVEGVREVDDKLVILARQLHCPILTNDYNLNRIAEIQGVMVLNVNELANAVKSVLLPGEDLVVRVIQDGKETGQGVGYMDDGTMVVVENGRDYMSQEVSVTVTKVLQTAAGRMIFAKPE